jgi:hypothetical protein
MAPPSGENRANHPNQDLAGRDVEEAIRLLHELFVTTDWQRPHTNACLLNHHDTTLFQSIGDGGKVREQKRRLSFGTPPK